MSTDIIEEKLDTGLRKNLFLVAVSMVIVSSVVAVTNLASPEEDVNVGMVEIDRYCKGIDVGVCLGVQEESHESFNYANYTEPEPGTPNFYRRVESELMAQAYSICDSETSGMKWTSEAFYRNQSASEWMDSNPESIQLLPCEDTLYRSLNATQ
jgi:hypothetical protein